MRRITIIILLIVLITTPVCALEYTAPEAPDTAQQYIPEQVASFSDGLWYIFKQAIKQLQPNLAEAAQVCLSLLACVLLASILNSFSGSAKRTVDLMVTLCIAALLVRSANSMINLGTKTVTEVSEYGKLLLPIMSAALAAQGATVSSAALYTGTAFFNSLLSAAIAKLIVPMIYIFMILCIAFHAIGEDVLKNLRDFVKWLVTWSIKTILYIFTGYLGITGVVSGTTDAATLKAAKLTISGAVPVVGNIISDASESILVGIGVMKSTVGIYGLLVILALWIGPFLQIGIQYLLLKLTAAICGAIGTKESVGLIGDFSCIMGFLVAMTGTVCVLLLVSIVCFLKGVG